ncbi:sugar phosphate isomerase/epimerase [Solitalea sp. MAHUQ-68]|uniref:Sugar phosphate isomerase/epimerase n=1 Tax=Solitalea agri TaxID=2953739 RepID=A0A9X2F489_9SPHI|nr:sugar phosphate isomerase/epimerase [Solitalea agri]MCO4294447.1 sugar phosphate isomerase/epimerase [Solitalea agri]
MKISRKTFLKQSGITAVALSLMPELLFAGREQAKIGLQLYSLRDYLTKDLHGVLEKINASGYNEVETYGYTIKEGFWGSSAKHLANTLTDMGLTSPSGHYNTDELFARNNYDELKYAIEAAKTLNQQYLVIPYLQEGVRKTSYDFKIIVERINKAAELCQASGLQLGYHNHDFEFINIEGTYLYKELLEGTTNNVFFELDLYWAVRAGHDPITLFNEHPKRFKMVHIKDMDKVDRKLNTEIGNGAIDFKPIIEAATTNGVKHFYVEQENFKINPFESIKLSADYVKRNLIK